MGMAMNSGGGMNSRGRERILEGGHGFWREGEFLGRA
jgi:hypothetical protein